MLNQLTYLADSTITRHHTLRKRSVLEVRFGDMEELWTLGSSRNETAFATISARGALGPIRSDGSDMPRAKRATPAS